VIPELLSTSRLVPVFHLLNWSVSAAFSSIPVFTHSFQRRLLWCWVSPANYGFMEWLSYYGPILVVTVSVIFILLLLIIETQSYRGGKQSQIYLWRNGVGISIICACWSIMFAHRLWQIVTQRNNFIFELVHSCLVASFGILCFYTFGLSEKNVQAITALCRPQVQSKKTRRDGNFINLFGFGSHRIICLVQNY